MRAARSSSRSEAPESQAALRPRPRKSDRHDEQNEAQERGDGQHDNFLILVSFVFNALTVWYAWTWLSAAA